MKDFWDGFEKQAGISSATGKLIGSMKAKGSSLIEKVKSLKNLPSKMKEDYSSARDAVLKQKHREQIVKRVSKDAVKNKAVKKDFRAKRVAAETPVRQAAIAKRKEHVEIAKKPPEPVKNEDSLSKLKDAIKDKWNKTPDSHKHMAGVGATGLVGGAAINSALHRRDKSYER